MHICDEDVDSEVKLVLVDQIWGLDVLLDDQVLLRIDLVELSSDEDALTLGQRLRLYYEIDARVGSTVIFQIF